MTRAWVEVDLGALRRNGAAMAARAGCPLLPMVKADAYGLGAVPVARALDTLEPWGFGVAAVDEGIELRSARIARPILVFTPLTRDDLRAVHEHGFIPALNSAEEIRAWRELGGGAWHLAIDTGMNRAGVRWDCVASLADLLRDTTPAGAFTHFHSAELDDGSMQEQERRFRAAIARLPVRPRYLHAANSAGIARGTPGTWDLARPGIFLYGVGSGAGARIQPEPVAHLRAPVVAVRTVSAGESVSYDATFHATSDRRIATLAIGYADGYRRALSNRGVALVRGRRAPVAGLVTMDMVMLDVTDVPCEVGDIATLIGCDGDERLDVETVARTADVSPYELLTGLRLRARRVYRDSHV
ncbi:MAG TPA: alanine racemase [Gemmatimonadaceae bacterium]|nr:alanine racemase [Gemmatimonadaceae bacterium]